MQEITEEVREVLRHLSNQEWCDDHAGSSSEGPYWVGKMEIEKDPDVISWAKTIAYEELGINIEEADVVGFWVMTENMDGEFVVRNFPTREGMDIDFEQKADGVRIYENL